MRNSHYNLQYIGNADTIIENGEEFPYSKCYKLFMCSEKEVLKGYWILPQWMDLYAEYGVKWMKITGRTVKDTNWHKNVIESYMRRRYDGNIMELGPIKSGSRTADGAPTPLEISGASLDLKDYIGHFLHKDYDCNDACGVKCYYCDDLEKKL